MTHDDIAEKRGELAAILAPFAQRSNDLTELAEVLDGLDACEAEMARLVKKHDELVARLREPLPKVIVP